MGVLERGSLRDIPLLPDVFVNIEDGPTSEKNRHTFSLFLSHSLGPTTVDEEGMVTLAHVYVHINVLKPERNTYDGDSP